MNKCLQKTKESIQTRGFTLLYASLIASLLTALGIAMFGIAQKELTLSSLGRESQYAFYAADTGAECATYWDFKSNAFATSTVFAGNAKCAGKTLSDFPTGYENGLGNDGVAGLGGTNTSTFWFETNSHCVYVRVTKANSYPYTKIESFGYNTKCSDVTNPRRLERAVRSTY